MASISTFKSARVSSSSELELHYSAHQRNRRGFRLLTSICRSARQPFRCIVAVPTHQPVPVAADMDDREVTGAEAARSIGIEPCSYCVNQRASVIAARRQWPEG
jgi:hypothetical protein